MGKKTARLAKTGLKFVVGFFLWPFFLNLWLYRKIWARNLNKKLKLGLVGGTSLFLLPFGCLWAYAAVSTIISPTPTRNTSKIVVKKKIVTLTPSAKPTERLTITPPFSPTPTPTTAFTPTPTLKIKELLKVTKVIDGDTIVLENGAVIRYIGIDTPEIKKNRSECFGHEAKETNKKLVLEKVVRLEKDVSETDKYNRLLRYVWVGDIFVNEYLVRQGYAHAVTYPPDVKYQELFRQAEKEARENNRGLWNPQACTTPTPFVSTPTPTPRPVYQTLPIQTGGQYTCDCSKTCSEISSCEEACFQLNQCGCQARDGDGDGIPCEKLCER